MTYKLPFGLGVRDPLPTSLLYGLAGSFPRLATKSPMGDAYRVGSQVVLVRCAPARPEWKQIHLLIDDDIDAAIDDISLPAGYRARLEKAWQKSAAIICLDRIRAVIVPSDALERKYLALGKEVHRIDPWWPVPAEYPGYKSPEDNPLDVAFLGTGSHAGDLEELRNALADPHRRWRFHHYLGPHAPAWLQGMPGVIAHKPLPWEKYRKELEHLRFAVCVYPARDTAVNRARSSNKFLEHAMTGAVALYGEHVPFARMIAAIDPSLLVNSEGWSYSIRALGLYPAKRDSLARASHETAIRQAALARTRQREIWSRIAQMS